ncbi:PTS sugar transporter subunit IIA [Mesorhizobium sp. ANAO-SY3R2]|uniref:PTS sugar transporter subunit IIA n=1 Tax=Mesorhizobium sp. ANAO-SY3R2 TaxID=3166644 RepID=UPI00366C3CE2
MNIGDVIAVEDVILDLRPEGKTRLLKELAVHAAGRTGCPAAEITSVLAARERLGSTGLGMGVAIPHAKMRALQRPFGAFVRLGTPCPFEAIDGQDVDLVVLLLLPEASPQEHLNVLARIARLLRDPDAVARLRQAADAVTIHQVLACSQPRPAVA